MSLKSANNIMWQQQPKQPHKPPLPPLEGDTPPPKTKLHKQRNDKIVINMGSDTDTTNTSSSILSANNSDNGQSNMFINSTPQIVYQTIHNDYSIPTNTYNNYTQQYVMPSQQTPLFLNEPECINLPLLNARETVHNLPITMTSNAESNPTKKRRAITTSSTPNKRRKLNTSNKEHSDIYCICRKGDDGSKMVNCDQCNEWFHIKCVNISKAKFKKIKKGASFDCPLCNKHSNTKQRACIMDSMLGLTSDEEGDDVKKKDIDLRLYRMSESTLFVNSNHDEDDDGDIDEIQHSVDDKLRYNVWE